MRYKLIPAIILVLIIQLVMPQMVQASLLYENHNTGRDSKADIYAANWSAQTFTVGATAHTVSSVNLMLYRVGECGNVTVSIKSTNATEYPTGDDLASCTLSASDIGSEQPSEQYSWVEFTMTSEYGLDAGTTYAIVVRATSGSPDDKIVWWYDSTSGYSSGNREDSTDSGAGWSEESTDDFMFEVHGASIATPPTECTIYENHAAGDDSNATLYDANWTAQTFTVGSTAHSVVSVSLKMYRTGTPGTMTIGVRATSGGDPLSTDLCSATFNATTITEDSGGVWYTIPVSPEWPLEAGTEYAVVVRAIAGDDSNMVHWRYDSSSGYANGNYTTSDDSGETWSSSATNDFMFRICGLSLLDISDVGVYASVVEDSDWLIVFLYKNMYPPYYQYEDPQAYFDLQFLNTTDSVVAQNKMPAWGYKPGSIYLSADTTSSLIWGSGYNVTLVGNEDKFDTAPSATYTLQPSDWKGAETFWLDDWIRTTASKIENYYSVDLMLDSIGNEELPHTILNSMGGEIYMAGVYNLEELRPKMFYEVTWSPDMRDKSYTGEYEEGLDWTAQLSTEGMTGQIPDTMNATASFFNIEAKQVGWMAMFALYAVVVGIAVFATGSIAISVAIGLPILVAGGWLGLIPLAAIMVIGAGSIMMFIWYIWLRST